MGRAMRRVGMAGPEGGLGVGMMLGKVEENWASRMEGMGDDSGDGEIGLDGGVEYVFYAKSCHVVSDDKGDRSGPPLLGKTLFYF